MLDKIPLGLLAVVFVAGALGGAAILWGIGREQSNSLGQTIADLRIANQHLERSLAQAESDGEKLESLVESLGSVAGRIEAANRAAEGGIDDGLGYLVILEDVIGELEGALRAAGLID